MHEEEIREGDIVEIDYIEEFTKEHINEGKALVLWRGHNNQPLVRKLNTKTTIWTCYEHIARVIGHTDIERYMDDALIGKEMATPEKTVIINDVLDKIRAEIEALPKTYPFVNHIDTHVKEDDVKKIIDKYKAGDKE